MAGNLALAGLLIVTFKNIYQRPRPAILHLVEEKGFSFPSGHSLAVTLMVGTLIVILSQRIKDPVWRKNCANRPWLLPSQCASISGLSGSSLPIRCSCQFLCRFGGLVYRISFL